MYSPTAMIGKTLGHYKIIELLGAGGMGEVYRAEDTTLGRHVALKVLPADLSSDPDRLARFEREAKTLAALDHPNIVTIHSVEWTEGVRFLTMQLVEGKPLSELIPKGGMPLERIFDIVIATADALAAAHEKGVIHRDLKPANIMVGSDGRVKVVDFGLAKLREEDRATIATQLATEPVTEEGRIVGTLPYMSPEQLRGGDLDDRSDIFSLGIVLYEMASGERPFKGKTAVSLISAVVKDSPQPVDTLRDGLPHHLGRVVGRCLEKNPERRYQTAKDVRNELEGLANEIESGSAAAPPAKQRRRFVGRLLGAALVVTLLGLAAWLSLQPGTDGAIDSLAVMPFENGSDDPDLEYLSDGLTDSLINSFAELRSLRVVHRSGVFKYKGQASPPEEVGRELGVRAVLTGQVTLRGNSLVVRAQLVDVESGSVLWGDRYTREPGDLLAVETEIASEIADRLRLELTGAEGQRLTRRRTESVDAYDLYLKGLYAWNKVDFAGMNEAITYFERAIEADPEYALPHLGLANVRGTMGYLGLAKPKVIWPLVKAAAERALALDDRLAGAHAALGHAVLFYDWDWPAAKRSLDQAITLDPDDAPTHHWYAHYWMVQGDMEKALEYGRRAVELAPVDMLIRGHQNYFLSMAGRHDQLVESCLQAAEVDSTHWLIASCRGHALLLEGRLPEAIAEFEVAAESSRGFSLSVMDLGVAYALAGRKEDAAGEIADLNERADRQGYSVSGKVARILAVLGETEQAFEWLERAFVERDPLMLFLEPSYFDGLRADPRFEDLVRRVGLQ